VVLAEAGCEQTTIQLWDVTRLTNLSYGQMKWYGILQVWCAVIFLIN